jgi:hypothetical protein
MALRRPAIRSLVPLALIAAACGGGGGDTTAPATIPTQPVVEFPSL